MQKEAFKIMGALLVLVLAVTFSVGAVSAYTVTDIYDIDIIDGSLVLTKDVPPYVETSPGVWEQIEDSGDFVSADTVYGALRTAYGDELTDDNDNLIVSALTADYQNNTVTGINTQTAGNNYVWRFFKNNQAATLSTSISDEDVVAFVLTTDTTTSSLNDIVDSTVSASIAFTCWEATPTLRTLSVSYADIASNPTGLNALRTAVGTAFTCDVSDSGWIVNIDNVTKNWDKTGYGWAVLKNDAATSSLPYFNVATGDVLKVWMSPAAEGGHSDLPATGATQWSEGYYLDGSVYQITVSITA